MALGAPAVAQEMVRISLESESDFVRFSAGMAVLDRVGLGKIDGHVISVIPEGPSGQLGSGGAAAIVAARLAQLSGAQSGPYGDGGLGDPRGGYGAPGAAGAVLEGDLVLPDEEDERYAQDLGPDDDEDPDYWDDDPEEI